MFLKLIRCTPSVPTYFKELKNHSFLLCILTILAGARREIGDLHYVCKKGLKIQQHVNVLAIYGVLLYNTLVGRKTRNNRMESTIKK